MTKRRAKEIALAFVGVCLMYGAAVYLIIQYFEG